MVVYLAKYIVKYIYGIMWVSESQIHQCNNICKAFVALYHYNMSTDANRHEKKEKVLLTYVHCMVVFISFL